ncbi:MAG: AAA family ATPase [Candidatus Longimicrobiales bacterium M2_2A_002]
MNDNRLRTAVISGNRELRATVKELLQESPQLMSIVADIPSAAGTIDADMLQTLHEKDPELVVADFADDPVSSLRLVRVLSEARPSRALIGAGPELAPELLLEAMRSGVSEYLPAPVDGRELAEAFRRVARKLGRKANGAPAVEGHLITFTGAKGGSGVSTAAVNAAAHAATLTGERVLLLDLDFEAGSSAVLTGIPSRYSILDLIDNLHRLDESLLSSLVVEHESGLHVLPAPKELVDGNSTKPEHLRTVLRLLRQHYRLVVVDTARPLSPIGSTAIGQSDDVFLVVNPDLVSLRNARRLLPHLREARGESGLEPRILLNRTYEGAEIGRKDVESTLELPVAFDLRRDEEAVTHSVNVGHPIVLNGSRSDYCRDARTLGLEVARFVDQDVEPHQAVGLMDRLKTRFSR